jgi:hypothetical protein
MTKIISIIPIKEPQGEGKKEKEGNGSQKENDGFKGIIPSILESVENATPFDINKPALDVLVDVLNEDNKRTLKEKISAYEKELKISSLGDKRKKWLENRIKELSKEMYND